MDTIAAHLSALLGSSKEYSYLIIGMFGGFILGQLLRVRGAGENFSGQTVAPSQSPSALGQGSQMAAKGAGSITINGHTLSIEPSKMGEIQRLIQQGNKIEAIKMLRDATALGLAEAKGVAEALEKALR